MSIKLLLITLLAASGLRADSITQNSTWRVWPGGSSANGGCFDATIGGGTDRSKSDSPFVVFNGSTITASNGGAGATITINGGYSVISNDVGNCIQITAGTNFTPGFYTITSVNAGSNTWTLNGNVTTGAGAAMVGKMGGALDVPATANSHVVAGNFVYVKSGTPPEYSRATSLLLTLGSSGKQISWFGYTTTDDDCGGSTRSTRPVILLTANVASAIANANNTTFACFVIDANSMGTTAGCFIGSGNSSAQVHDVTCKNAEAIGFNFSGTGTSWNLWETGHTTAGTSSIFLSTHHCFGCMVTGGTTVGTGISLTAGKCVRCIVANRTGASADGFLISLGSHLINSAAVRNGRHGIVSTSVGGLDGIYMANNILSRNAGTDFNSTGTTYLANQIYADYNAFDTTGTARSGVAAGAHDVTLTGDPFTAATSGDFSLNNVAGAGAACRGTGSLGLFANALTTGYIDIGPVQHQDTGGGGGTRVYSIASLLFPSSGPVRTILFRELMAIPTFDPGPTPQESAMQAGVPLLFGLYLGVLVIWGKRK